MPDPTTVAIREQQALSEVLAVVEKYDEKAAQHLRDLTPAGLPHTIKQADEFGVFVAEALAVLARRVEDLDERIPKKRGRKPKSSKAS